MARRDASQPVGVWLACATPLLLLGCGDDDRPPPVTFDAGDDGGMDGGDGGMDGGTDGALPTDGDVPDGGPPECELDPARDVLDLGTDSARAERRIALAPAVGGHLAVWSARTTGVERVFARFVPSFGSPGAVHTVSPEDRWSSAIDPDVARDGSGGFVVAWYDNSSGNFEIHTRLVGARGAPEGDAQQLTSNDARDDNPALLLAGDGVLAAWVAVAGDGRIAQSRQLADDATGSGSVRDVTPSSSQPSAITLSRLREGSGIAWADRLGTESHLRLQALDGSGATTGDVHTLDSEGNVGGHFDVATTHLGGAAVFGARVGGVRPEVRLRFLDETGAPRGGEQVLTAGAERERAPSVARFRGGFVVATRLIDAPELSEPTIRLVALDDGAEPIASFEPVATTEAGGRTTTAAALDGSSVLVAWAERGESETRLRAARLRCGSGEPSPDGGVDAGTDAGGEDGGGPTPVDASPPSDADLTLDGSPFP